MGRAREAEGRERKKRGQEGEEGSGNGGYARVVEPRVGVQSAQSLPPDKRQLEERADC